MTEFLAMLAIGALGAFISLVSAHVRLAKLERRLRLLEGDGDG